MANKPKAVITGRVFMLPDTPTFWIDISSWAIAHNLTDGVNYVAVSTVSPKRFTDLTTVYRVYIRDTQLSTEFRLHFSEHILGDYEPAA